MMATEPNQVGEVTKSGYSNTYMTIRWLTKVFDPYTRDQANGTLPFLFLSRPDIHTSVNFLKTCWDCHIVCIILPANLSAIFQLLDVDFFIT